MFLINIRMVHLSSACLAKMIWAKVLIWFQFPFDHLSIFQMYFFLKFKFPFLPDNHTYLFLFDLHLLDTTGSFETIFAYLLVVVCILIFRCIFLSHSLILHKADFASPPDLECFKPKNCAPDAEMVMM